MPSGEEATYKWVTVEGGTQPIQRQYSTPSSSTTAKFGTGAVRSSEVEDVRYDLITPIGLREVARAAAEGARKYSDFNWEKGMPVHDLLNHAIAHCYRFLEGDRAEPHLGHAAWNILAAIHSSQLWPHLNDGTLRGPGCTPPTVRPVVGERESVSQDPANDGSGGTLAPKENGHGA
jgi:hypothetical protein